jgi:hypothetical protein
MNAVETVLTITVVCVVLFAMISCLDDFED